MSFTKDAWEIRLLPRRPDVSLSVVQNRSVAMNFELIGGTHPLTAAADKRDSQRIPIVNFGKRDVYLSKLADRQNGDRFAYSGCYRLPVSLKWLVPPCLA